MGLPTSEGSPVLSCVLVVCLISNTCLIRECASKPTQHQLAYGVSGGFDQDDLQVLYSGTMNDGDKQKVYLEDSRHLLPQQNHGLTPIRNEKRERGGQPVCPPGINERECNYELMAVWLRLLMKENQ